MEQTLSALRDFLQSRSGFASILIAPTRSMGRQLLDAYAARFGGALGVRVHTPDTLALELCGADCPGLLPDGALLVLSLLRKRGAEARSLPAARAVLADLQLLERENVLPAENPRLAELSALLEAYRAEKARRGLWDRYDLFAAAAGRPLPAPAALCANVTGEGVVRTFLEGLHAAVLPVPSAGAPVSAPALFLPQGEGRGTVSARLRFARGYGRENEALYPFYDLLERRIPFGQAAILWAGRETRTLLREQAARLGVPLTLDGGVPLEEGTLLPLLRALAAWHRGGCPVEGLPGLMAGGLVPPHGAGLLRFLRKNHAGGGLPRCLNCLEGALNALPASGGGPEEEPRGRLTDWLAFFRELEALFSPETGAAEGTALLGAFLLERYVKVQPQVRGAERAALLSALEAMADQASGSFCSLLPDLLDAAAGTPWQSAAPRDGAVHAAPLSRGAFLDRPYTYILGLERDALTAPGRESPLLRDEERAALGLPLSDAGADLPAHHLGTVLAAAGGEVTLSYSCFDTEKLLSTPPSPAYEKLRGQADPVLFGYRRPASLTGADRWLEGQGKPAPASPPPAGTPEMDPDFVFSASSLELALDCPRRFYFQYLLQVPQEERTDPARRGWLPANAFGSLVHEALEDYFGLLIETKAPPDLEAVWAARLAAYERAWPCADPALRQREARRAKDCVLSAVRHFRESQADSVPLAVELTFGRKSAGGGPPEMPEVFTLELDRETAFRFTGSVDRLDRLPSGALRLVDYKTGDPGKFYRDFSQKLQYFLYARALRQLAEGPVERAEYLFLSPGGVRTLGVKDPGGNQDCLARVKALMNLLRAGQALEAARPVWEDGAPRWGGEDARGRRETCARYCPYAGLCEEVRP